MPIHLRPTAALAPRVLLPGDPARALLLAQNLLSQPAMFNHNRGLWGYTGQTAEGEPLTIQSTGMGGPSAAIVVSELAELGATCFLRVGTCGALRSDLALGHLVIVTEALAADGTSRALGADRRIKPDASLTHALLGLSGPDLESGPVVSTDLFYDGRPGQEAAWSRAGAVAVEMECATLFALAGRFGVRTAALVLVTDLRVGPRRRHRPKAPPPRGRRLRGPERHDE